MKLELFNSDFDYDCICSCGCGKKLHGNCYVIGDPDNDVYGDQWRAFQKSHFRALKLDEKVIAAREKGEKEEQKILNAIFKKFPAMQIVEESAEK